MISVWVGLIDVWESFSNFPKTPNTFDPKTHRGGLYRHLNFSKHQTDQLPYAQNVLGQHWFEVITTEEKDYKSENITDHFLLHLIYFGKQYM